MSYTKAVVATGLAAIALSGCGGADVAASSSSLTPDRVPLVPGVQVVAQARQCDRGANAFCSLELVVVDRGVRSSGDLVTLEGRVLQHAGWSKVPGDAGNESGADSPSQQLHLAYGTALADLTGFGVGWFTRSQAMALVLSHELTARVPAMALTLRTGPA
jgi:hypothetical protein